MSQQVIGVFNSKSIHTSKTQHVKSFRHALPHFRPFTSIIPPQKKYATVKATAEPITATNSSHDLPELSPSYEAVCSFTPYANWIIPGTVLLGRYPYVEPSRCLTRNQGDMQLEEIIDAGITTFVSLQQEVPPQDQMRLAGVDGFLPYKAQATLVAASRAGPPRLEEISALRTPQLDKFLPPRRRPDAYPAREQLNLEFLHYPIVDLGIPSEEALKTLVHDLKERIERGQRLYIHCWGGRGRAGTVGAALLISMYGLSAEDALERVQRSFDTRRDENRKSPETDEQHAFVKKFAASMKT